MRAGDGRGWYYRPGPEQEHGEHHHCRVNERMDKRPAEAAAFFERKALGLQIEIPQEMRYEKHGKYLHYYSPFPLDNSLRI